MSAHPSTRSRCSRVLASNSANVILFRSRRSLTRSHCPSFCFRQSFQAIFAQVDRDSVAVAEDRSVEARWLAIVNHQDPAQETNDASGVSEFNEDLEQKSIRLREHIGERFGRALAIGSIDSFPGFQLSTGQSNITAPISGTLADSIATLNQLGRSDAKLFVKKSNESAATRELSSRHWRKFGWPAVRSPRTKVQKNLAWCL